MKETEKLKISVVINEYSQKKSTNKSLDNVQKKYNKDMERRILHIFNRIDYNTFTFFAL